VKNLGDVGAGHVLGRYELLMPIATGGMATVWAARLKGTRGFQKIVAIKTILPQLSEDPTFEQMFLDEASLASRIRHPNVAQILDLGEEAGVLFIVMDWVEGEPLSAVLKAASRDTGSIPLPITIRIISQAAAGLHAAHELRDESGNMLGLVHRDASPQNILVTFDGVVKVVDFGIAKAAGRGSADTNAGQIKGKAAYMSPEQVKGGELDRRTDVFALGTILYLMTTGRHPFRGANDVATLYSISSDSPVMLPSKLIRNFPLSLEAVVMKALAKDPRERFASAHDLQRALDMALPASQRLTTDAEVAAFMHHLLNERHEQRKTALKVALQVADERAQGRQASPSHSEISHTGFTPPSQISSLKVPRELGSGYPKQRDSSTDAGALGSAAPSVGGMTTATDHFTFLGARVSSGTRVALAALGLGMALAAGFLLASRWMPDVAPPEPQPATSAAAVAPPPAQRPEDLPVAPPAASDPTAAQVDSAEPVEKGADAQVGHPKGVTHPPPFHPQPPKSVAPPAPKPPSSNAPFVPPVRNPGF
jgi:eukaryotic-like serine/threonine-protein kinase